MIAAEWSGRNVPFASRERYHLLTHYTLADLILWGILDRRDVDFLLSSEGLIQSRHWGLD